MSTLRSRASRLLFLLMLLAPLLAGHPAAARAQGQAPDLSGETITYGEDKLPDRVRDFYTRTLGDANATKITNLGNAWYQNWSPDAQKIAIVTEGLQLSVMNPDGSGLTTLANGAYSNPFWSPDARFIAYLGGEAWGQTPLSRGDLWLVASKGGTPYKVPGGDNIPSLPAGVAWAPDATKIAAGFPGHIFDLTSPDAVPQDLPGDGKGMWVLGGGWSPDGKRLAVTDGNRWGVLDIASGKFTQVATAKGAPGATKGGAGWAPTTGKVVFSLSGTDGSRVFVADIGGANAKLIWSQKPIGNIWRGDISSIGPPGVDPPGRNILIRVTRQQTVDTKPTFVHETWLLQVDGSKNEMFIPYSFNAVWKPKPRFQAADPAFFNLWRLTDNAVATGQAARTWIWGPQPIASMQEPWADAPGGNRLVEYYDKGRMEVSDPNLPTPSKYYVTSGLLVRELTTGQLQTGAASFEQRAPADILVAGDADDPGTATYATFGKLGAGTDAGKAQDLTGQHAATTLLRDGTQGQDEGLGAGVTFTHYVAESSHNIPDVFWNWLQTQSDWVSLMGYPISEPYWVYASIGGKLQPVLAQLYERRTLTFNVQNDPAWRVELGNVGLQYKAWRYGQ